MNSAKSLATWWKAQSVESSRRTFCRTVASVFRRIPVAAVRMWAFVCKRSLQQLRACLPAETGLQQDPDYVVGTDFLAEGILTASAKFKVDLIVMGANQSASARMAAHNPWAAVHEVVRNAPCPVLTVAG